MKYATLFVISALFVTSCNTPHATPPQPPQTEKLTLEEFTTTVCSPTIKQTIQLEAQSARLEKKRNRISCNTLTCSLTGPATPTFTLTADKAWWHEIRKTLRLQKNVTLRGEAWQVITHEALYHAPNGKITIANPLTCTHPQGVLTAAQGMIDTHKNHVILTGSVHSKLYL